MVQYKPTQNHVDPQPYPKPKEHRATWVYCEDCDRNLKHVDLSSHLRSKAHKKAEEAVKKAAAEAEAQAKAAAAQAADPTAGTSDSDADPISANTDGAQSWEDSNDNAQTSFAGGNTSYGASADGYTTRAPRNRTGNANGFGNGDRSGGTSGGCYNCGGGKSLTFVVSSLNH